MPPQTPPRTRLTAQQEEAVYTPPTDPLYVTPEALFPTSYVLPISRRVKNSIKAQWFADWRAIADCFLRFPDPRRRLDGSEGLASRLSTACSNELQFVPSGPRGLPSPFALVTHRPRLPLGVFGSGEARSFLRDYVLDQYVPGNSAMCLTSDFGSWRVAEAVADVHGLAARCAPAASRRFDPLTPEYDAMVRLPQRRVSHQAPGLAASSDCPVVWGWTGVRLAD